MLNRKEVGTMDQPNQPPDDFQNYTIGFGEEDELPPRAAPFPIKVRIIKVGNSGAVLIPHQLLKHLGFSIGDYVSVMLQPRTPDEEEIAKEKKRKAGKKKR